MPSPTCVGAPDHPHNPTSNPVLFSPAQELARALLEGPQRLTCLAGGTRSGKTFLIVRAILGRAIRFPESRHAILRFHTNAARASIALDTLPHVRKLCYPAVSLKEHRTDGYFALKNDARIVIGGLDDDERVEKILGLEYASVFLNEASQIPYESALIALTRLAQVVPGCPQRAYVDLNPTNRAHWTNVLFGEKRDPVSKQPLEAPEDYARAFLNPPDNAANLTPAFLASLAALPERQRKRFYEGQYVDALEEALWHFEAIEAGRAEVAHILPAARKQTVVGVDPAGREDRDETGIVVAALGHDGHAYVLADWSCQARPEVWANRVVEAAREHDATLIVAETNYGGDMVPAMIRTVDPNRIVKEVKASTGKAVRAAPISTRYAQGRVHHVGRFTRLEEQLCAFTAMGYAGEGSPDRADAAIWALTALFEHEQPEPGLSQFLARGCT